MKEESPAEVLQKVKEHKRREGPLSLEKKLVKTVLLLQKRKKPRNQ